MVRAVAEHPVFDHEDSFPVSSHVQSPLSLLSNSKAGSEDGKKIATKSGLKSVWFIWRVSEQCNW